MDQDIRFQMMVTLASSAAVAYFVPPYRSVVRDIRAIPQDKMSSAASAALTATASISSSSTTLGAVAFTLDASSDAAAGVPGTYTTNASTGSTVLAADQVIKLSIASAAAAYMLVDIELDPYARSL